MTDRKTHLEIEIVPLDEAESLWGALMVQEELTDGEALDAILTFAAVDGSELVDHDVLVRIEDVIELWRRRNR